MGYHFKAAKKEDLETHFFLLNVFCEEEENFENWDENEQVHIEEENTINKDEKFKKSSQVDPTKIKKEEHEMNNENINVEDSTEIDSLKMMNEKIWPSELDNNTTMKDNEKIIIQENKQENNENKICLLPSVIEEKVIVVIKKCKSR